MVVCIVYYNTVFVSSIVPNGIVSCKHVCVCDPTGGIQGTRGGGYKLYSTWEGKPERDGHGNAMSCPGLGMFNTAGGLIMSPCHYSLTTRYKWERQFENQSPIPFL